MGRKKVTITTSQSDMPHFDSELEEDLLSRVEYASPKDHYIHSARRLTVKQVAKAWAGIKGCSHHNLANRAVKERWLDQRKRFWKKASAKAEERMATKASRQIVKANERHIGLGKALQGTAAKVLRSSVEGIEKQPEDLKPGEGLRVSASMAKTGVEIERKGLGLADQVVHVQNVREIVVKVLGVISRHVHEPDVLQNIIHELKTIEAEEEEQFAKEVLLLKEPESGLE